jgi:hypothetical protein
LIRVLSSPAYAGFRETPTRAHLEIIPM